LHNVNSSFSNSKPDYSWWTDNNQSEVRNYHLLHLAGIFFFLNGPFGWYKKAYTKVNSNNNKAICSKQWSKLG
jgi:hypothetical protein